MEQMKRWLIALLCCCSQLMSKMGASVLIKPQTRNRNSYKTRQTVLGLLWLLLLLQPSNRSTIKVLQVQVCCGLVGDFPQRFPPTHFLGKQTARAYPNGAHRCFAVNSRCFAVMNQHNCSLDRRCNAASRSRFLELQFCPTTNTYAFCFKTEMHMTQDKMQATCQSKVHLHFYKNLNNF